MKPLLILLFLLLAVTVGLVIYLTCFSSTRSYYTSSSSSRWNPSPSFNRDNYTLCAYTIQFLEDEYETLKSTTRSMQEIKADLQQKLGLIRPVLVSSRDNILKGNFHEYAPVQFVSAIVAQIQDHPEMGVVAFRGTKNNQEWETDLASQRLFDISKPFQGGDQTGEVTYFPHVEPSMFAPDTMMTTGWFDLYNRLKGPRTKTGCYCKQRCRHGTCPVLDSSDVSKMDDTCSPRDCGLMKCDDCTTDASCSLAQGIWTAVHDLATNHGVKSFIFTGHSLGGAMVTISAFHIAASLGPGMIHSCYPIAAPRVGNQVFVNRFNKLVPRCYRVDNTRDWVNNVPLGKQFAHVGNNQYVFTSPEIPGAKPQDMPYHELITVYLKDGLQQLPFDE